MTDTATELEEVRSLDAGLVDYIGIGPVHATQSKKDHNPILGVRGTRDLLAVLSDSPIKVVAIGGLNEFTITNLWRQTRSLHPAGRGLDGVAYVSAVAASSQPREAANRLTSLIRQPSIPRLRILNKSHNFVQSACELLAQLRSTPPLVVQHVTNQVVMNDCANLTLALTRSPIMSGNPEEADDLGRIIGALVLNMGTLNDRQIEGAHLCGKAANRNNKPVLLDPVGVGATQYRKQTIADLMDGTHMSIVKVRCM
ncbi:thiamine biosynthetic bifunctional enzyme [Cystobasidiomycetes sp. EMM_F5]